MDTVPPSSSEARVELRRSLLDSILHPRDTVGLLETQLRITAELLQSEMARRSLGRRSDEYHELKWHEVQLRQLGDTIAWLMLEPHTIRSLARAPAGPASISGQLDGLQHVVATAIEQATSGAIVLLADITNFIGSGDLVCLNPGDGIEIVECKAGGPDSGGARGRRQRERLEAVADYLETGVQAGEGPGEAPRRIAIDAPSVTGNDSVVVMQEAVATAMDRGSAMFQVSEHELIIVGSDGTSLEWPASFRPPSGAEASTTVHVGFSSDLVNDPSPRFAPVTLWDLPLEQSVALWEKDLIVAHCVSSAGIVGSPRGHPHVEVTGVAGDGVLEVSVAGTPLRLSSRFIGRVLYDWITPSGLREEVGALAASAVEVAEDNASSIASPGARSRISFR